MSFKIRSDLNISANHNFECVFVQVRKSSFARKIIGSIYRPPNSDLDLFMWSLQSALDSSCHTKVECLLAGDFNLDLFKHDVHLGTEPFINCLYQHSMIPLITRPTWFTADTITLIDNICSNKADTNWLSGILIPEILDYIPVLFYISTIKIKTKFPKFVTINTKSIANEKLFMFKKWID